MSLQAKIESYMLSRFGHAEVSNDLRDFAYEVIGWGIGSIVLAVILVIPLERSLFFLPLLLLAVGAGLIGFGWWFLDEGLIDIPAVPKHNANLTIWGTRVPNVVIKEKSAMRAVFPPFKIDYEIFPAGRTDFDFTFEGISCAAAADEEGGGDETPGGVPKIEEGSLGPKVRVHVSGTLTPDTNDPLSIIRFQDQQGMDGVLGVFKNMLGEGVRLTARRFSVSAFTLLEQQLSAYLLIRVGQIEFRHLGRNPDGTLLEGMYTISPEDYLKIEDVRDAFVYLFEKNLTPQERLARDQELLIFFRVVQDPNVPILDAKGLGVTIDRLNVDQILPPEGLSAAAEEVAIEERQEKRDLRDARTEAKIARQYIEMAPADDKPSWEQAMLWASIRTGKTKRVDVGPNRLAQAAAAYKEL